jgi:hypothetical protein
VVPDTSIWDPQVQTDYGTFRIQSQQPEVPSSDVRASQSLDIMPGEESLASKVFLDEQAMTSFWAEPDPELDAAFNSFTNEQGGTPISRLDSPFMQPSGYQEDTPLAADIFEGDENLATPIAPVSLVEG